MSPVAIQSESKSNGVNGHSNGEISKAAAAVKGSGAGSGKKLSSKDIIALEGKVSFVCLYRKQGLTGNFTCGSIAFGTQLSSSTSVSSRFSMTISTVCTVVARSLLTEHYLCVLES